MDYDTAKLHWVNVNVSVLATGFGALCQRHQNGQFIVMPNEVANSWDMGIMRNTAASMADSMPGPMEIGGIIGPEIIPAPITVIKGGLSGVITP